MIEQSTELFPPEIWGGYKLSGHLTDSKTVLGIRLRQRQMSRRIYIFRPSFVMSCMSSIISDLEYSLFLLSLVVIGDRERVTDEWCGDS